MTQEFAQRVVTQYQAAGKTLALAESCTGGLIAAALTAIPGASQVLRFGWVCYSSEAKQMQLGVEASLIEECGIVSDQVARAMAEGALQCSGADVALAITGNAGPTAEPGSAPVGFACVAIARKGGATCARRLLLPGLDRNIWRHEMALRCLSLLLD